MVHYVAIVEEEPDCAVEIWFPDLPGCLSAGDTLDEAMLEAREAVSLWAESTGQMPRPRSLTELKGDAEAAADIREHMVALIPFEPNYRAAAE